MKYTQAAIYKKYVYLYYYKVYNIILLKDIENMAVEQAIFKKTVIETEKRAFPSTVRIL